MYGYMNTLFHYLEETPGKFRFTSDILLVCLRIDEFSNFPFKNNNLADLLVQDHLPLAMSKMVPA